jgi:ferredoxin
MLQIVLVIVAALILATIGAFLFAERSGRLQPSTRALVREGSQARLSALSLLHSYVYARFPKEYIGYALKNILPKMSRTDRQSAADHYHGKVLSTELAQALVTHEHDIALRDLEQIIPYPVARNLLLKGPPDVAVFECPCRATREHPCEPTQVCMIIGQPFVDFILEHHPAKSRRLTQRDAVELLQAEHERGHVHAAYFKDAMLDRFYAICNCCKCCCGSIESMVQHGVPMITSSGFVAQIEDAFCTACGTCEDVCPFGAIHIDATAHVTFEKCMGCGVCEGQCAQGAVSLTLDARKGLPLDVRAFA